MDQDANADLTRMAVELYYLREAAKSVGEPFLAYLIDMAAVEAQRRGAQPQRNGMELARYASGETEKPGG